VERAGTSITITSVTNFLAFALGSITVIPAVNFFCIYAFTSILCDFLVQGSFFLAIVVLYEKRDDANGVPAEAYRLAAKETSPMPAYAPDGSVKGAAVPAENPHVGHSSFFDRIVLGYANVLMKTPVRVMVIIFFVGYGVMCVALHPTIKNGLPQANLAPDDSFLVDYYDVFENTFDTQVGVDLGLYFQGFDHSSPDKQARILASWGTYLGSAYTMPLAVDGVEGGTSSPINWLTNTLKVGDANNVTVPCRDAGVDAALCVLAAVPFGGVEPRLLPAATFNASLNAALAATPDLTRKVRRDSDGVLTGSYITTRALAVANDYPLQLAIYKETGQLDDAINAAYFTGAGLEAGEHSAFTFQEQLVFWQQDAFMWSELMNNMAYAGSGVLLVCIMMLVHPVAVIVTAGVGVVDLFLFGSMVIGNIRFNAISMVNLVMAVGLSVDYTLHFCHAFLATPASPGVGGGAGRVLRVKQTMLTMGSSILKGGGTTLIGTLPLAFSSSTIFRVFFAMLFSTVIYGLAVGLILIPVVLSVLPLPDAPHLQEHDGGGHGEEGEGRDGGMRKGGVPTVAEVASSV